MVLPSNAFILCFVLFNVKFHANKFSTKLLALPR